MDRAATDRLLTKLGAFAASLDEDERAALGALLRPALARAHAGADDEVVGFASPDAVETAWDPDALPKWLLEGVHRRGWSAADLGPDADRH